MKNETIVNLYLKDINEYGVEAYIRTDKRFYQIKTNRFNILESPDLSDCEVDNYWKVSGLKIIDIGTDGMYTLIQLSDNRFIHYDIGGDWLDFGVYPAEDFDENIDWLHNYMYKLSLENNYLPLDWVRPE